MKAYTCERVASATRQRTKLNRQQTVARIMRKATVLPPKCKLPGFDAKSACVTDLVFGMMVTSEIVQQHLVQVQVSKEDNIDRWEI